jgi:single stranded DNA-binding protein
MNIVYLNGKLGRDPEIKQINDTQLVSFSIAVEKKGTEGKVTWIDIKAWGKVADSASKALKGSEVVVKGSLAVESWVDKATQANRTKTVVVADSIEVFDVRTVANQKAEPEVPSRVDTDIPF